MDEREKYRWLDFVISVVKPWDELHSFLKLPYALDSRFSDPVIEARALAVSVQHQGDYDVVEGRDRLSDKDLKKECPPAKRIRDFGNTIKHVERRTRDKDAQPPPEAHVSRVQAEFLVDNDDQTFQFLRNKITYRHDEDGEFNLLDDLREAVLFSAARRGIDLSHLPSWAGGAPELTPKSKQKGIYLIHDPKKSIYQGSQDFTTNELDNGNLKRVQPSFGAEIGILEASSLTSDQLNQLFS